jgi:hypothetical protein|tara:strand:- start:1025 stop:1318 length:294 start_codon:yes stop_codon:yes gene_type:complete
MSKDWKSVKARADEYDKSNTWEHLDKFDNSHECESEDLLDITISNCFKKVDTLKKDLKELTLLLGHLEEKAKKLRDDLNKKETLEIKSLSNNEYEVY